MKNDRKRMWNFPLAVRLALLTALAASVVWGAIIGPAPFGYMATDETAFSFEDISTTGVGVMTGADDARALLDLGFTFKYYGRTFTKVCASVNGVLTLGECDSNPQTFDFAAQDLTASVTPGDLPTIAPLWFDLTFSKAGAGAVYYQTLGTAPDRRMVIQWHKAYPLHGSNTITFQAILFEATGKILFQYQNADAGAGAKESFGGGATVGIRDTGSPVNGRNLQWSYKSPVISNGKAILFSPDAVAPSTKASASPSPGPTGWNTTNVTIDLKATDNPGGSGVKQITYSVNGGVPMVVAGSEASPVIAQEGNLTFAYHATDSWGNQEVAKSLQLKIDKTGPVVTPPTSITVPATEVGGARGANSTILAAFLAAGFAAEALNPPANRLAPQVANVDVTANTLFPSGTTSVTFRYSDALGNIGTASADVTVTTDVPHLVAIVAAKSFDPPGTGYVDVNITNTGTGPARGVTFTSVDRKVLAGNGVVTLRSSLAELSAAIGDLPPSATKTVRINLIVPPSITRFSITEAGSMKDAGGISYTFSLNQEVIR